MSIQKWQSYFKPEAQKSGQSLFQKNKITLIQLSDTEIMIYVKASSSLKLIFKSSSVNHPILNISCHCPQAKKMQFCKHIWAGLLAIENKNIDFFESKISLARYEAQTVESVSPESKKKKLEREAYAESIKIKQAQIRKEHYQKQKAYLNQKNEFKKNKSNNLNTSFSDEIEQALKYFSENGFDLKNDLCSENINSAKKKLARVFHPDRGGSHQEILDLNKFSEVLLEYSKK